jgi:hypothetical protein
VPCTSSAPWWIPLARLGSRACSALGAPAGGPNVLAALGRDLRDCLHAIFDSQFGSNLRNNTAHGTLPPTEDHSGAALLTVLSILAVCDVIAAQLTS